MMERGINSPLTSSCGRLFDTVAALLGVRSVATYEGQAAIELEGLAERGAPRPAFSFVIGGGGEVLQLDFRGMIRELVEAAAAGDDRASLARAFHVTIATASAEVCDRIRATVGMNRVVVSGGVFQNKLLAEGIHDLLMARNFQVFTHRLVPPNDGGLALGQAIIAGRSQACA